ncbi:MAG: hypothetical protein IJH79_10470, partial [Lentisphaeria bacterium]|nr:hypothetical protein [Lentisphaeria bacterium]
MDAEEMLSVIWRVFVQIAVTIFIILPVWGFVCLIFSLTMPTSQFLLPAAAVFFIGIFLIIHSGLWHQKIILWIGCSLMVLALLFGGAVQFHRWWTVDRFAQLSSEVRWWEYAPFKGKKTVQVTPEAQYRLSGKIPTMDGAYALYPVYAAVVQSICPRNDYSRTVRTNGSDVTFARLLGTHYKHEQPVDLIFSAPPSRKQLKDAAELKLTYEITPFAREAFV